MPKTLKNFADSERAREYRNRQRERNYALCPGDDDVRDTINSLQQAGRHQWQGIPDQLARDAALGKILFYSGHSVPLLICVQFPVSLHVVKVYCGFPGKAILTFLSPPHKNGRLPPPVSL